MSPMDESPSPSAQATPTPSHEGRGHSTGLSPPLATVGAVCPPCGPSLLAKTSGQWKRLTGDPGKRINSGFNSFGGGEIRRIYSQLETSQRKELNPELILSDASSSKASTLKSILEKEWLRGTYPQRINLEVKNNWLWYSLHFGRYFRHDIWDAHHLKRHCVGPKADFHTSHVARSDEMDISWASIS